MAGLAGGNALFYQTDPEMKYELLCDEMLTILKYPIYLGRQNISWEILEGKQAQILERIKQLESRLIAIETNAKFSEKSYMQRGGEPVARVERATNHILSVELKWVPEDYYSRTIGQRRDLLCCTIPQMLKSVVVENTACTEMGCDDRTNSRFYVVMVQYEARFNAEKLLRAIRDLRPEESRLPRRKFNFQFAAEEVASKITGFSKGSVTPFGMSQKIPVVLTNKVVNIHPSYIWMGGGHIHLKLGVAIRDFFMYLNPIVADVTDKRTDDVENAID